MVTSRKPTYRIRAKVWPYVGMAAWRFVTIPKKYGQEIKEKFAVRRRGWGSVPVTATLGKTTWSTSIFPDKHSGSYLLPLRATVRKAERVEDNASVSLLLTLR